MTAASSWSLAVISADRLLSVVKPLKYKIIVTRAKAALISVPWIVGFLIYGPAIIVWDYVNPPEFVEPNQCYAPFYDNVIYILISVGLDFFVPYALVWIFSMMIFKKVQHQRSVVSGVHTPQEEQHLKRIQKTARSLAILISCYGITWAPYVLTTVTNSLCGSCVPDSAFEVSYWLMLLNSAINPFIYPIMQEAFRKTFKRILLRPFKCNNQVEPSG